MVLWSCNSRDLASTLASSGCTCVVALDAALAGPDLKLRACREAFAVI